MNTGNTPKKTNPLTRKPGLLRRMIRAVVRMIWGITTRMVTAILTRLPKAPETHNKYATIAAYAFIGGMVFFLSLKVVPNDWRTYEAYYLWDKAKDCLFIFCLLLFCKPLRRFLLVILLYALIRLSWQIFIAITNENINDTRWINFIWLTTVIYMTYLSYKELKNGK